MIRIKQRSEDFRVRELLREGLLSSAGEWRVYRVTTRKLSSLDAAARLAELAGAVAGEVSMAGLKDRQGVTLQHMALRRGRELTFRDANLRIESAGFAAQELDADASRGNAFEIVVRGLERAELDTLRANMPLVREQGVVNYFDDQRFGNLRHGQGWIALLLLRGRHEDALRALLTARSSHDDRRSAAFKSALARDWGDWAACRDVAGRFGAHHSVFEHLKKNAGDFAGAFTHVSLRLRLIHLYAFQSHLWNRAVAAWVREATPAPERIVVDCLEGPLVFPARGLEVDSAWHGQFPLPGAHLAEDCHTLQRALLVDALAHERLVPAEYAIQGVGGFVLKAEARDLFVVPRHLRVRPSEPDPLNRGLRLVKLRFELPRGAYATLVIKRLLCQGIEEHAPRGGAQRARGGSSKKRSGFDAPRAPRPTRARRPRR